MIRRIRYYIAKMTRLHHSRGFGVQSPTDFSFVREVINERSDYYQYNEIEEESDSLVKKLGRLYFRIANWRQPAVIETYGYEKYLHGGCKSASFGKSSEMICMSVTNDSDGILEVMDRADDSTVLIVEGIHSNNMSMQIWKKILADERARVCYDLYLCGIVMFDKRRYKIDYIINF